MTLGWILIGISAIIITLSICLAIIGAIVKKRNDQAIEKQARLHQLQIQSASPQPEKDGIEPIVLTLPIVYSANVPDNVERKSIRLKNSQKEAQSGSDNENLDADECKLEEHETPRSDLNDGENGDNDENNDHDEDSDDMNDSLSDLFIEYDDEGDAATDHDNDQNQHENDVAIEMIRVDVNDNFYDDNDNDHDTDTEGEQDPIDALRQMKIKKLSNYKYKSKRSRKGTIQVINIVDESKYQEWTVLLLRAKFDKMVVKTFLKEFKKMLINGKTLQQYKENVELIDELRKKFSKNNQIDGIWKN